MPTSRKRTPAKRASPARTAGRPGADPRISAPAAQQLLKVRVTLDGVTPAIWRQLVVPDNLTFVQLHRVIQAAFGWEDYHLHQFEVGDRNIGMLHPDGFDPTEAVEDERLVRLAVALDGRRNFRYWYDFGDDWWHEIVVEERVPDDGTSARLLAGARACPPEDCGGPSGFMDLCETLADPTHPDHAEMREWSGNFDPERFDLDTAARAVARALRSPRRSR